MSTSRRSEKSTRSTTGCTLCKTRRKKCDETKPQCRRCQASGNTCAYEYVEYSEGESHRTKRTKPAPRTTSQRLPKVSWSVSVNYSQAASSTSSISRSSALLANSVSPEIWSAQVDIYPGVVVDRSTSSSLPSSVSSAPGNFHGYFGLAPSPTSPGYDRPENAISNVHQSDPIRLGSRSQTAPQHQRGEDDDDDPEGVRVLLCVIPTVDKNVKDNSLPFVLHCYAQWAIARVFEPLKVAHAMREQVIAHFSSENSRTRTILIANVMNMFAKDLAIDSRGKSILNQLALAVRKSGSAFMATPASSTPQDDRQNAMRTLDSMLEIFSLQTSTQTSAACLQLLDDAALVFRRACSEPPGQPINLPNILLTPNLNLRHFATMDIIKSATTGLPTYFQYEVPFSLELCDQMYQMQDSHGLQWLHGSPDQFILMFAWINSLCETPGAGDNLELITWIETNLPRIKIAVNKTNDPLLRIGRIVVQECWRFVVKIYLYMVLCKANACDPRVVCAQKGFMRLLRGVKPARHPDAYLYTPYAIAGVATIEERDRDTLRQRILNVRECSEPGTAGNDVIVMLEDIWARTRNEARAAVWSDLGVASTTLRERQSSEIYLY